MEDKLKFQNIHSLLISLSIPAICGQIVTLIYNMVDRFYIGRLPDGSLAMAAIGLCVPLTTMINAFNGLFGRGGSPLSSMCLGHHQIKEADDILTHSFLCLVVTSLVITLSAIVFRDPLLYFFGANHETIGYARDYMTIYALGTIFIQITVGLNYFINAQGYTKFGMMTVMLGVVLNILLDPIFIFTLHMGMKGAALATILSQAISCAWVLHFFFSQKTLLHINLKDFHIDVSILKRILTLGASPFFMSSTEGLLTVCFNQQLLRFGGNMAVSSMTIMTSMWQLILLPIEGIAQGSQPIISYNYGAKATSRVKETIDFSLKVSCCYSMIMVGLMTLFPKFFVGFFTQDQALLELGSHMLVIYIFGGCIMGINSTCQQTYNSLGDGKKSFFFAFYRKIILLIPMIFLLPHVLGHQWIYVILAEPISDLMTTATNYIYFKSYIRQKLV